MPSLRLYERSWANARSNLTAKFVYRQPEREQALDLQSLPAQDPSDFIIEYHPPNRVKSRTLARSVISIGFETRARFPGMVSDESSRSLCGGAPSGEIARAHVRSASQIHADGQFREGWRGPLWQERFHSYPMGERRASENIGLIFSSWPLPFG
jgi:hypothetical protein